MKRILVAVACLLPFGLAAEAGINRHSPEAAVNAAYAADEVALHGRGAGIMSDNTLRARFFSRSLLRSIAAGEIIASGDSASPVVRDPFTDQAPHLVALSVAPISETRAAFSSNALLSSSRRPKSLANCAPATLNRSIIRLFIAELRL